MNEEQEKNLKRAREFWERWDKGIEGEWIIPNEAEAFWLFKDLILLVDFLRQEVKE